MALSWINNRSLKLTPRARLVDEAAEEALRRKRAALAWVPENGFLKDQQVERRWTTAVRRAGGA
jgi:hypothetical protein